jgi:hypothetical protein
MEAFGEDELSALSLAPRNVFSCQRLAMRLIVFVIGTLDFLNKIDPADRKRVNEGEV